jgi:hypothetical protein
MESLGEHYMERTTKPYLSPMGSKTPRRCSPEAIVVLELLDHQWISSTLQLMAKMLLEGLLVKPSDVMLLIKMVILTMRGVR